MTEARSPQLEDGHIRIANELFDAILAARLKYSTQTVLLAVLRKTYGYGKKEDDVSASQIGEMCGMKRPHVTAALNELAAMNVIHKRPGRYGAVVGINKDYSTWMAAPDSTKSAQVEPEPCSTESVQVYEFRTSTDSVQVYENGTPDSTKSVQVGSTKSVHTKDNFPKDNQQKTCASADAFALFWAVYPKKKSKVQAEKAFRKINPNEQLLGAMLAAIERAKKSDQWRREGGQFIPYPASWLNAKRWEDEDDVGDIGTGGDWWVQAGFQNMWQAENEGCTQRTSHLWRDGQRAEVPA